MPKTKLSITFDETTLAELEHATVGMNRSEAIEFAVRAWLQQDARARLDAATEAYYRGMTDADRAEDAAWARLGDDALRLA